MPKILILGWSTSNHVYSWVNSLRERGYDITVISYDGAPIEGVEVISLPKLPAGKLAYLWYAGRVKKLARQINPDLIHAHYLTGYGLWGVRAKGALGCPLIVTALGSDVDQSQKSRLYSFLVSATLNKATAITAPSEFLLSGIRAIAPGTSDKQTLIPWGIDLARIKQTSANHTRSDNKIRILFFKHLQEIYGAELLLRAFAECAASGKYHSPTVELTLAGRGAEKEKLQSLSKHLKVSDRVFFPGFVAHEKSYDYIAEHDIMVMPTLVPEGFGMAALEASALGLPVIASNHGAVPEIVQHKRTGLLFESGNRQALSDALAQLIESADLRKRYGSAACQLVKERFDWNDSVNKMDALYQKLLYQKLLY